MRLVNPTTGAGKHAIRQSGFLTFRITNLIYRLCISRQTLRLPKGAFIYDVRCFSGIFDLPTYPHQILYYISLFSKIRRGLTYLPTQKSGIIYECSLRRSTYFERLCTWKSRKSEKSRLNVPYIQTHYFLKSRLNEVCRVILNFLYYFHLFIIYNTIMIHYHHSNSKVQALWIVLRWI